MLGVTMSSRFSMAIWDFSWVDELPNSALPKGTTGVADLAPFSMVGGGIKIGVIRRRPSEVRASICLSVGPFMTTLAFSAADADAGDCGCPFEYLAFSMSGFSMTTAPFCEKISIRKFKYFFDNLKSLQRLSCWTYEIKQQNVLSSLDLALPLT